LEIFDNAIKNSLADGGKVLFGGNVIKKEGNWVEPTIIEINRDSKVI